MKKFVWLSFISVAVFLFLIPLVARADFVGQTVTFFVDPSFDTKGRSQITAKMLVLSQNLYIYVEDLWFENLDLQTRVFAENFLKELAQEFDAKIYPTLTVTFGSEWKPGIDGDNRITLLLHDMPREVGGYFNTGNEFPRFQNPKSNEREMLFLNINNIGKEIVKSFLAHEFVHLITFNQKDKLRGVQEEIWLNEVRAELASTLLGYDNVFEGSNLKNRLRNFSERVSDSLTEWQGKPYDYGQVNLFGQYLVDHYGMQLLVDSLKNPEAGIASLNQALIKQGANQTFADVFTNWVVALALNDCALGDKYCYKNPYLQNFKVPAQTNFLPTTGESALSLINVTKDWAGNWFRVVGGRDNLKVSFQAEPNTKFVVPYVVEDSQGKMTVNFLEALPGQEVSLTVPNFSSHNKALLLMPLAQTLTSGLDQSHPNYRFGLKIATTREAPESEKERVQPERIQPLLAQIEFLKQEIARAQALLAERIAARKRPAALSCSRFDSNLFFGLTNNHQVRCLQAFLKSQGADIYPEGLVTGNFLTATRRAVIKFQVKYRDEILTPLGFTQPTGYVGPSTRSKINALLGQR